MFSCSHLGATYDDHLRLIGKRVVDFLLVLIELFSLGVTAEALRSDHITPVLRQLHWLPVRQRVAFKIAGLAGAAPVYRACHLPSDAGRRPLRSHSNDIRKLLVPRTQQTWRQEFLGSRFSTVERSSTRTAAAGTFLRFFQTIFENTSLWRLKRLVTLSTYRRCTNESIYLSTSEYRFKIGDFAPTGAG